MKKAILREKSGASISNDLWSNDLYSKQRKIRISREKQAEQEEKKCRKCRFRPRHTSVQLVEMLSVLPGQALPDKIQKLQLQRKQKAISVLQSIIDNDLSKFKAEMSQHIVGFQLGDISDDTGRTALMLAVFHADEALLSEILATVGQERQDLDLYIFEKDQQRQSALDVIIINNHLQYLCVIVEACLSSLQAYPSSFIKMIDVSVRSGQVEMVKYLISHPILGSLVQPWDLAKWLQRAAGSDDKLMLRLLIESSAPIDYENITQLYPLHLACKTGNPSSVELLVDEGASINRLSQDFPEVTALNDHPYSEKVTPLMVAISYGNLTVADMLLRKGADLNPKMAQLLFNKLTASMNIQAIRWLYDKSIEYQFSIEISLATTVRFLAKKVTPQNQSEKYRLLRFFLLESPEWCFINKDLDLTTIECHASFILRLYQAIQRRDFAALVAKINDITKLELLYTYREFNVTVIAMLLYSDLSQYLEQYKQEFTVWIQHFTQNNIQELLDACIAYSAKKCAPIIFSMIDFSKREFSLNLVATTQSSTRTVLELGQQYRAKYKKLQVKKNPISREGFLIENIFTPRMAENLSRLVLSGCSIGPLQLREMTKTIANISTLTMLDLSHNMVSYRSFINLLKGMSKAGQQLRILDVSSNRIALSESKKIEKVKFIEEVEYYLPTTIQKIDLTANYISSSSANPLFYRVLWLLLERSGLMVSAFVSSQWHSYEEIDKRQGIYEVCLLEGKNTHTFRLSKKELHVLRMYRDSQNVSDFAAIYNDIRQSIVDACQVHFFLENRLCHDLNEADRRKVSKMVLRFSQDAPLKYYLKRHPVFHCYQGAVSNSALLPSFTITPLSWVVYLVKTKSEHAMLAWEGMTKSGQHVLKVAHLQYDKKISIQYYERNSVGDLIDYFNKHYSYAGFHCKRSQIKQIAESVDLQVREGVPSKYRYKSYFNASCKKNDEEKVTNCLRWAVDMINAHTGLNISAAMGNLPSWSIQKLKERQDIIGFSEPANTV